MNQNDNSSAAAPIARLAPSRRARPLTAAATLAALLWLALSAPLAPRTAAGDATPPPAAAAAEPVVDTALVLAIDVSNSVDANRYKLQMEGVARALEDESVVNAITGGTSGAILLSLVEWSDSAQVAIPWRKIASAADAASFAAEVRQLPQSAGEYTCMAKMLAFTREIVIPDIPLNPRRRVIDISGDGIDNCEKPGATDRERDALIALGVTINGLPVIVKGENDDLVGSGAYRAPGYGLGPLSPDTATTTLDSYYEKHVIGGPGAFLKMAQGFEDFGRAFRQKFVTEVSGLEEPAIASRQAPAATPALQR